VASAPRSEGNPEIREERARILPKRIHLDLPPAVGSDETGSQAVTGEAADEVGAGDTVVHGDEDGVCHYPASSGNDGRSE
jgi:hypothetical protein